MDRETDRYVIRCNNFVTASAYAAAQEWSLHEWSWFPAYTINNGVQVFERMRDVSDKVYINLKKYDTPTIDPLKEYYDGLMHDPHCKSLIVLTSYPPIYQDCDCSLKEDNENSSNR